MSETVKEQLDKAISTNEPWLSEDLPFNFTATGFLGAKRKGMLSNPLLLKDMAVNISIFQLTVDFLDRVGRGRSSSDAIFGNNYRCPWTMANALNGWAGVVDAPQQLARGVRKDKTDYMSLNRGAVSAAMISSSDIREFRTHKARVRQTGSIRGSKRQERPLPKVFKPETIYGRPHEYESIEALTTYSYQRQWLLNSIEGMLKARPHLSTFRAEKPLLEAQKFQELDSVGREGQTGQGIPKNTPHEHLLPPMKGKCSDQFPCA